MHLSALGAARTGMFSTLIEQSSQMINALFYGLQYAAWVLWEPGWLTVIAEQIEAGDLDAFRL
jgi:hypothetical protein